MDDDEHRLLKATYLGDTDAMHQLVQDNPFILSDTSTITSHQNILNTAIKTPHPQTALQIARYSPHLLTVQDRDGLRPLDVASAYGSVEIVREFLILAPNSAEICRTPGRDGKSAIHHACINGRVDVMQVLVKTAPDCVRDVTFFGETVVHLAVKYYRFEALASLLQWLEKSGIAGEVLGRKDKDDNTVLHYAALRKQLEAVELLLDRNSSFRNSIEINAVNSKGLTAMEIVDICMETSSDFRLKKLIQEAQGSTAAAPPSSTRSGPHHHQTEKSKSFKELVEFFKFNWKRDSPSEVRNAVLVVAVLFATVAAQGIYNPPSQLFPDNNTGIVGFYQALYLAANWCVLLSAASIMDYLTQGMPFKRELFIAEVSLGVACGLSIGSTHLSSRTRFAVVFIPILLLFGMRRIPQLFGRIIKRADSNGNRSDNQQVPLP